MSPSAPPLQPPRQSEKSYRTLAESLALFVWASGQDGNPEYLNRHWQEYTGLSAEETHQGRWEEVVHPDDLERVKNGWVNALESGEEFEFEYRVLRASDKTYRWHLGRVHPVRDEQERIIRWFGTEYMRLTATRIVLDLETINALRVLASLNDVKYGIMQISREQTCIAPFRMGALGI